MDSRKSRKAAGSESKATKALVESIGAVSRRINTIHSSFAVVKRAINDWQSVELEESWEALEKVRTVDLPKSPHAYDPLQDFDSTIQTSSKAAANAAAFIRG